MTKKRECWERSGMAESGITKQALILLAQIPGVRVWPQRVRKLYDPESDQWLQFGIGGMADISGIAKPDGWRLEIEMKKGKGHRNKKTIERQENWRRMIVEHGGIHILARSAEDAVEQLLAVLWERRSKNE